MMFMLMSDDVVHSFHLYDYRHAHFQRSPKPVVDVYIVNRKKTLFGSSLIYIVVVSRFFLNM